MQLAVFVPLLLFTLQLIRWCVLQGESFREQSENNFLFPSRVTAPRGLIMDRDQRVLAFNRTYYRVLLGRFGIRTGELQLTAQRLKPLLGGRVEFDARRLQRLGRDQTITLANRLALNEALPVLERQGELPGMLVERYQRREYTAEGNLCCHLLGFLGFPGPADLQAAGGALYAPDDWIGKAGLERRYEDWLRGEKGFRAVMRDSRGRVRQVLEQRPPRPGVNLLTTLDAELQQTATELIAPWPQGAVALLMDARSGALLCCASNPGFDLNQPAERLDDPAQPRLNRALREIYPPGSTFKVVTALAALSQGWDAATTVTCTGRYFLPEWKTPYRCNARWGHGAIDLEDAIKLSCNVYFYHLARKYGERRILDAAERLGLGAPTGIDLPPGAEAAGLLPRQKPYLGERLQLAIGQWELRGTPLQILTAYAALGNGGRLVRPHLLLRTENAAGEPLPLPGGGEPRKLNLPAAWLTPIRDGLWGCCNQAGGTAFKTGFPRDWNVAGKTATATRGAGSDTFDDAWFVAFAPADDARIAALVMIERGGHGGDTAAPLVKKLLEHYFAKYPLDHAAGRETALR